jgi:diacylglycerol kinase (ATP)
VAGAARVAVVINPVAGVRGTLEGARQRASVALDLLEAGQVEPDIFITERGGHAAELARGAVARGADIVVAWGGDGTVNEVASAIVGTPAALAVIPSGSGNGLARMLGMPNDPRRAIGRILNGTDRIIDVGEIDGHLFVNVAGVGFDAHIATAFAAIGRSRRGFLRYSAIVVGELRRYDSGTYTLVFEPPVAGTEGAGACRAFLLTFANGRQWGNGAVIAPSAELDDGVLDAVVVEDRGLASALRSIPRLFQGTILKSPGVSAFRIRSAVVTANGPLIYHADGEPHVGGSSIHVVVRPGALKIRA